VTKTPEKSEGSSSKTRVALVTGGSGGIGQAIVRKLAETHDLVVLTYRKNLPHALVDELGSTVLPQQLDVSDPAATEQLFAEVTHSHGDVSTLVHAAGPHVPMTHLSKVSPEQFASQANQDLNGFFNVIHAAIPSLRRTSGSVVVVTTAATTRYPVRDGLSAAPKGGVEALARAFAAEEGRFGIRVNCVGPGMLTDGMSARLMESGDLDARALEVAHANIPLRRFGSSMDIAEAVAFLASDKAGFITGQKLDIDGGYGV